MLISDEYRALNAEMHARDISYGVSGQRWSRLIESAASSYEIKTLLDYGCGQGTLKASLPAVSFEIIEYDPAIEGKRDKPLRVDMVACTDVMEHVEPACVDAVLDDVRNIFRVCGFFVIGTRPAGKVLADGRNAHLIVEPIRWWLPRLNQRWHISALKDIGNAFFCLVTP